MLMILRIVIPIVMVIADYNPDSDGDPIIRMTTPAVSRFSDKHLGQKWHVRHQSHHDQAFGCKNVQQSDLLLNFFIYCEKHVMDFVLSIWISKIAWGMAQMDQTSGWR